MIQLTSIDSNIDHPKLWFETCDTRIWGFFFYYSLIQSSPIVVGVDQGLAPVCKRIEPWQRQLLFATHHHILFELVSVLLQLRNPSFPLFAPLCYVPFTVHSYQPTHGLQAVHVIWFHRIRHSGTVLETALKFSGDALYSHSCHFFKFFKFFFNLTSFTGYFYVIFESRKAFFIFLFFIYFLFYFLFFYFLFFI